MRSAKWSVKGKHVFITGGSQGLGLSLAELVVEKGADVTICARSQEKLEAAVRQIKKNAHSGQKVSYVVADVSTFESARKALESASSGQDQGKVDRIPDVVFCCAGASKPGYFIEQDESRFAEGIKTIYMTALSTAHATTKLFIANKKWDGKLVLTGSTLSFTGIVGYAQYAPMKWAIRGLAETLRSEFLLYNGLSIHAYFPGTILSPGYIEEEKTKPKVTQSIEDGEKGGQTPLQCAKKLLEGVENNNFIITSDFDTDMLRAATSIGGTIPSDNFVLDRIKSIISLIGVTFWRKFTADSSIRKFAKQNPDQVPGLH
ncbi:hypothetical protein L7F22_019041 [Adiantum nelumboides]|nr:hypothetical protein [Adiantum nelumboides]